MAFEHVSLGLEELHFQAWLRLWKRTSQTHLPELAVRDMSQIANQIVLRLRSIVANKQI
jgi:hemoglobin